MSTDNGDRMCALGIVRSNRLYRIVISNTSPYKRRIKWIRGEKYGNFTAPISIQSGGYNSRARRSTDVLSMTVPFGVTWRNSSAANDRQIFVPELVAASNPVRRVEERTRQKVDINVNNAPDKQFANLLSRIFIWNFSVPPCGVPRVCRVSSKNYTLRHADRAIERYSVSPREGNTKGKANSVNPESRND